MRRVVLGGVRVQHHGAEAHRRQPLSASASCSASGILRAKEDAASRSRRLLLLLPPPLAFRCALLCAAASRRLRALEEEVLRRWVRQGAPQVTK